MARTTTQKRRLRALAGIIVVAIVLGVALTIAAMAAASERISLYRYEAAAQPDGSALIREQISYDFGSSSKHGIFRTFPGYVIAEPGVEPPPHAITELRVTSNSAPADVNLDRAFFGEVKIGSPDSTTPGRHTYQIEYRLPPTEGAGADVALNVIGTGWPVPIDRVEATIAAPGEVVDARCVRGEAHSESGCSGLQAAGRELSLVETDLDANEGVTVYANIPGERVGTQLAAERDLPPGDPNWAFRAAMIFVLAGLVGYAIAIVPITRLVRSWGRDWAWHGSGPADLVYGGATDDSGAERARRRISDAEADGQLTVMFTPPPGLGAAQGGYLLEETVNNDQRIAWLIECSIQGWLAIDDGGKKIRRLITDDRWAAAPEPLRQIFDGRDEVTLGKYDKQFAAGWKLIDSQLEQFHHNSGLWDAHAAELGHSRAGWISLGAVALALIGGIGGFFLIRSSSLGAAAGSLAAGLGVGVAWTLFANRIELNVRTPQGFALRQLTEGFRRFFSASETRHVMLAAESGRLREYSAWAVALDQVKNWNKLVKAAKLPDDTPGIGYVYISDSFSSAASSASVAPSSSSGGGGGVGGGGGGGGGGSW